MRKMLKFIEQLINIIMVASLSLMVILVFTNVVLRYAFDSGIASAEELSRFLFVWLTFMGAALAFKHNEHLGVDTIVRRLPIAFRKIFYCLSNLLMLLICVLILDGSWKLMRINVNSKAPTTGLPLSVIYVAGVFMGAAVFLILMVNLYKVVTNQISTDELIAVKESEEMIDLPESTGKEGKPV